MTHVTDENRRRLNDVMRDARRAGTARQAVEEMAAVVARAWLILGGNDPLDTRAVERLVIRVMDALEAGS